MKLEKIQLAKKVLDEDTKVLYGTFGTIVKDSGYFPPLDFLNEFLLQGTDPCDQDGRMADWKPFILDEQEYQQIISWWKSIDSNFVVDSLNLTSWNDWLSEIIEGEF